MNALSSTRILVVGDVMYDVYEYYSSSNGRELKSEFPGKWAYSNPRESEALGGAANVAANLARAGVATRLIGVVGYDDAGIRIKNLCSELEVESTLIKSAHRPTTVKMRIYVDGDFIMRRDREDSRIFDTPILSLVEQEAVRALEGCTALVLSDYDKGLLKSGSSLAPALIQEARLRGLPVIVDCKPPNIREFRGATMLAPNEIEAACLVPWFSSDRERGMRELHEMLGVHYAVVTLGEDGLMCDDGHEVVHVPAEIVKVKNPVGAGDSVRAFMAIGLSLGLTIPRVLGLANRAAALVIQKEATATVTREEADSLLGVFHPPVREAESPVHEAGLGHRS